MFDIITFGSATWDVFVRAKNFEVLKNRKFITGKGICFNLGSKIDVENVYFSSGGGGTNAAATFAKQGFKVAYCGRVGNDVSGREIIEELKNLGIDCQFVLKTKLKPTNYSVVLTGQNIDRTILGYREASENLTEKNIPYEKLSANWFYIAPPSEKTFVLTKNIVDFAQKNRVKIAFNPSICQLSLAEKTLKRILKKINILILNQEEASLLTNIEYNKEKEIFKKIDEMCPGIAIMTKGPEGVVVSDGKELYQAKILKVKVVDRTGAGDSFGSGFVSGFIRTGGNIEYSIQLGIANSASCLQKWGAKNGLLKEGDEFEKVKVIKKRL